MYDIVEVSPVRLEVYCNCDQPDVRYSPPLPYGCRHSFSRRAFLLRISLISAATAHSF